jgi:hypothetical protein
MPKKKDIFEEVLRAADEDAPLSALKARFSDSPEEFEEVERVFATLREAKEEAVPSEAAFRNVLRHIEAPGRFVAKPALVSAKPFSWHMAVPALAFAALAFAFLNYRHSAPKDTAALPNASTVETQSEGAWMDANKAGKQAVAPLPTASGKAEDIVTAMFTQMEEENASLSSQMDEAASSAARDSQTLDEMTYDENQI